MIDGAGSRNGVAVDIGVLAIVFVVLVAIGGRLYPRLAQ
jgi:hypothetical protein